MPTYDYLCKLCGHALEIFQSMSEGAKRKCPACGKQGLERQIGMGSAVLFKGSGYYQTDYRSKGYEEAKKADQASQSSSSSKQASSSSKPAAGDKDSAKASDSKASDSKSSETKKTEKPSEPRRDSKD